MTEWEICYLYRQARNKYTQIQILGELTGRKRTDIIGILIRNGEKLPKRALNWLYRRLDKTKARIREEEQFPDETDLSDARIAEWEEECREIEEMIIEEELRWIS